MPPEAVAPAPVSTLAIVIVMVVVVGIDVTIYFFPSTRWDILTIDGVLIKLPQNNIIKPLNLAYKIIASKQFKGKNIIDLRVKNHLIIK